MRITIGEEVSLLETVYVSDFGDNYHRTDDEPTTDLEKAARKIRRRYKNIADYMGALAVYNEYMAMMMMKHGGPQLFKIKLRDEVIDDFIPAKPRMKNTAHNKILLKKKIMVSSINVNKINHEKLEAAIESNEDMLQGDEEIVGDTETKDPVAKRLIKEGHFDRIKIGKVKEINNIDFLEEYFRTKNVAKAEEAIERSIPLSKIVSGEYDNMVTDTTEQDDIIYYRGAYMNRATVNDLRVYQDLGERGWNSIKLMKEKGVSKRITKIVENQNKKNKKKNKKSSKKKSKNDDFFVKVMSDNNYDSFGDYQQDMMNFTASNVLGD
jgi:hypothetical protein